MFDSSVILALFLLISLKVSVLSQKTFMNTCECEYVTNGKCAYTILLPIGDSVIQNSCPSRGDGGGDGIGIDMEAFGNQLRKLETNVSDLSSWSLEQVRLLAQLQAAVLELRLGDSHNPVNEGNTSDVNSGAGVESPLNNSTNVQYNRDEDIRDVSITVQALQEDLAVALRQLNSTVSQLANLQDLVQNQVIQHESLAAESQGLQTQNSKQDELLDVLSREVEGLRRLACSRRGLLVSGSEESISDLAITASSLFNIDHGSERARINNTDSPGAWCPREPNDEREWLQFDLGRVRTVVGVVTKGRYDFAQWVTSYHVHYSHDQATWTTVTNVIGEPENFVGNFDQDTVRVNMPWQPFTARYVRIIPQGGDTVNVNRCLRADVIGCLDDETGPLGSR